MDFRSVSRFLFLFLFLGSLHVSLSTFLKVHYYYIIIIIILHYSTCRVLCVCYLHTLQLQQYSSKPLNSTKRLIDLVPAYTCIWTFFFTKLQLNQTTVDTNTKNNLIRACKAFKLCKIEDVLANQKTLDEEKTTGSRNQLKPLLFSSHLSALASKITTIKEHIRTSNKSGVRPEGFQKFTAPDLKLVWPKLKQMFAPDFHTHFCDKSAPADGKRRDKQERVFPPAQLLPVRNGANKVGRWLGSFSPLTSHLNGTRWHEALQAASNEHWWHQHRVCLLHSPCLIIKRRCLEVLGHTAAALHYPHAAEVKVHLDSVIHAPLTLPEDESSLDAGLHFLRQVFNIALSEEYKR